MGKSLTKVDQRNLIRYFIFTYLLFWSLLGLTGFLISREVPEAIQTIMKNVCAWTPTFVLLLMFKRLYHATDLRDYLRNNLLGKTKFRYFIIVLLIQAVIFVGAVATYLVLNNLRLESIPFISGSGLIPAIVITVSSGATGEELGWRAYALKVYQKRHSPLKSALFMGLVWGFWHLPLMMLSGYTGIDLVYYCFSFMFAILSVSIIITFFYNKGRNILMAMWIHFLFNFSLTLVSIDQLQHLIYLSAGYLLSAIILLITQKKELLKTLSNPEIA